MSFRWFLVTDYEHCNTMSIPLYLVISVSHPEMATKIV